MPNKKMFIPSVFTFFNLFLGFLSIVKTIEGSIHTAAWLIIISALCDAMDGKVARWTGMETRFGFELDSLTDVVSFGMAPTLLVYVGILQQLDMLGIFISFLFLFGGAYRLARFNSQNANEGKHVYIGLTIPIAAITVASFWLFEAALGQNPTISEWTVLISLLSMLMMSTIPYRWPRLVFDEGRRKKTISFAIIAVVLSLAIWVPDISIFPLLSLFIVIGIVNWTVSIFRGEAEWTEFFIVIKRNN